MSASQVYRPDRVAPPSSPSRGVGFVLLALCCAVTFRARVYKQFDFDLAILHRFGTFLIAPVGATPIDRPPWDTAAFLFLVFLGLPFALRRQYRNVHAAALIVSVTLACFLGVLLMLPLVSPYKGLLSVPAFWLCIVAIYGLPAAPPQVVGWVVDPVVAKLSLPWRNVGLPVLRFSMGLALWPIAATHHLAAHRRQIVPWILAAIVASAVLLVWCVPALRSLPPTYPAGDQALLELYTLQATEGDLSVGAYSRKGWNHPGPAYFYALAPLYALTKHEFSLHWTVLLLNLISVAAAVALATRCGGWSLGLGLMAALSIYLFRDHPEPFSGFGHLLMSAWNPHTPVLPFAVLLLLCARLASGSFSVLPWVVLVASLVVQANVALVPCAAVVASTSMLLYAVRGRRSCSGKPSVFSVHSAIWMFALLWFLPLGEQLQGGADGNIAQIFNGFAAESQSNMAMQGYLPTPSTAFTVLSNALWTAVDFEAQVPNGGGAPVAHRVPSASDYMDCAAAPTAGCWRAMGSLDTPVFSGRLVLRMPSCGVCGVLVNHASVRPAPCVHVLLDVHDRGGGNRSDTWSSSGLDPRRPIVSSGQG